MKPIHDLFQAGRVAIIQGVGYPGQSETLSHFRATDIWLSGAPDRYETNGWLADYLTTSADWAAHPLFAASVTDTLSHAFTGRALTVPTIASIPAYQVRTDPRYASDRDAKLGYVGWASAQDYTKSPLQALIARTATAAVTTSENVQAVVKGNDDAFRRQRIGIKLS